MVSSNQLRTLIVDDEALARERIAAMLADLPTVAVVGEAESGSTAVKAIADLRPDLLFLDVQMPGLDGFGVLRCTAKAHRPIVVFVTAHDEHAVRAFEVCAADYLLKPVTRPRLEAAVRRATERVRSGATAQSQERVDALLSSVPTTEGHLVTIPVPGPEGVVLVRASEVDWMEADGDHVRLHGRAHDRVLRATLTELEERLRPFQFMRVHRSAIVNAGSIHTIESISKGDYWLILRDGTRVRTSRQFRKVVQSLAKLRGANA